MQPIPHFLLVHSAAYEQRTGVDADGGGTYATAVSLAFIRVEPVKAWLRANVGEMQDDKLTLFYDCVNSEPTGTAFSLGDRITFQGAYYTVRESRPIYADESTPHHYEVYLK